MLVWGHGWSVYRQGGARGSWLAVGARVGEGCWPTTLAACRQAFLMGLGPATGWQPHEAAADTPSPPRPKSTVMGCQQHCASRVAERMAQRQVPRKLVLGGGANLVHPGGMCPLVHTLAEGSGGGGAPRWYVLVHMLVEVHRSLAFRRPVCVICPGGG
jgi:hypothetical protein